MIESFHLRDLLVPELESEFAKTRKVLEAMPDGHCDFKPHDKSMSFARLAGHVAELPTFITTILTTPQYDFGTDTAHPPLHMESKLQVVGEFNEFSDKALTALKHCSDETLHQHWNLCYKTHKIFSGKRYTAYRDMGLNHLIHHRAQLGVYLRLLHAPVPSTFGPTADEPWNG